jgi:small conductance mechanosensitive channel
VDEDAAPDPSAAVAAPSAHANSTSPQAQAATPLVSPPSTSK